MLTLESPVYEVNGILVYRDHAVPTQFYYAAPAPRIARSGGKLMFDLMAYQVELKHSVLSGTNIPDELGAGFLTMGAECSLSEMQRSNLVRGIKTLAGIEEGEIQLYPIPYHKGTMSVIALDAMDSEDAAPADSPQLKDRPTFVEKIMGTGKPSLLGGLRCIFSLSLSQEGVGFMQGLYADGAAPVGVVYDLSFYGLRPSIEVVIRADLSKIYKYFGGGLGGKYSWFQVDIGAAMEKLHQQNVIDIQLTSQATGEAAEKSKELALSLFKDRIIQELFRPTSAPSVPSTLGTGGASGGISGLLTRSLTGSTGSSSGNSIAFTLQMKKQEELREVEYKFSERAPEERTHAPQGFLSALLTQQDLERHVHLIDLGSSFFETLEVLVSGPSKEEFEQLDIRQIDVNLTYGVPSDPVAPESKTLVFRADSTGDKVFAVKRRGRQSLAYTAGVVYEFTQGESDSDSFRYEMDPETRTGRSLRINPYSDFGWREVEVELGRMPPDVRQVDVDLSYSSSDGTFAASENIRLIPGDPEASRGKWRVRTIELDVQPYSSSCTLVFDDGVYKTPSAIFSDRLLRVDSPFLSKRELLIKPAPKSQKVTEITVELEYNDSENDYSRKKIVRLQPPFASVTESWPILDPARQTVRYRVTIHEPGFLSEGEWMESADPSIIVGTEGHKTVKVQIQLVGSPLSEVGVDAVQVRCELLDVTDSEVQNVLLTTQTTESVDFILPPDISLRYRYQTISFKSDGGQKESQWKEMTSALLVIQTQNL